MESPKISLFPLLALPLVTLLMVLRKMNPLQLLSFSQCSPDARHLAKRVGVIWRDIEVVVKYESSCSIEFRLKECEDVWLQEFISYKTMREAMVLCSEVFNWKMNKLVLNPITRTTTNVGKFLRSFQRFNTEDVEYIVTNREVQSRHRTYLLESCAARKLSISHMSHTQFSHLHENIEEITVSRSHLFANDLLAMSCATIVLNKVYLAGGICWFIKRWQSGCNAKLEVLYGNIRMFDWETTVSSIPGRRRMDLNVIRQFTNRSGTLKLEVSNGYDVERFDGTMGTICSLGQDRFFFVVWKDHCKL